MTEFCVHMQTDGASKPTWELLPAPSKPAMPRFFDGIRQISISPDGNWGVSGAYNVGQTNSDVMVLSTIHTIPRAQHQISSHTHSVTQFKLQVREFLLMILLRLHTVCTRSARSSASRIVLTGRFNCTGPLPSRTFRC